MCYQLLRGRISKRWLSTYSLFASSLPDLPKPGVWVKSFIRALWKYSQSLWLFRNGEVHGHNATQAKEKERHSLREQVTAAYERYTSRELLISFVCVS